MRPLNFVSADEAVSVVKTHDHIHISSTSHESFLDRGSVPLCHPIGFEDILMVHPENRESLMEVAHRLYENH